MKIDVNRIQGMQSGEVAGGPAGHPAGSLPEADDLARFWEFSPAMLSVGDYDGYLRLVNPPYREALGWSDDELMSVPYWELIHPDDQDRAVESDEEVRLDETGLRTEYQVRMLCRNGSYLWTRWNIRSIPQQQLRCAIGVPIADPGQADPEEPVLVGCWAWHIPANTVTWSDGLQYIFDPAGESSVLYETFLERIQVEDRLNIDQCLHRSLSSGEEFSEDFRIVHITGGIRWIRAAGRLIADEDGNPERISGIAQDASERRERGLI